MIAIVGGGRMGRGLALALAEAGERVQSWSRREGGGAVAAALEGATTVILAVPDDALGEVAASLAAAGAVTRDQVILHLSGLHDRQVLVPLRASGAALGSLHPLQSVSDPATAAARWRGAYAVVEGDDRALGEAERIAGLLGLVPVRLRVGGKTAYHAAAVLVSNDVVALVGIAARLAREAGIAPDLAERMFHPLLAGTVENLRAQPAVAALTGPVRRGDVATLQAHLAALGGTDRTLYAELGLAALELARRGGLDGDRAAAVEAVLREALARSD
jgi:predicted short-subunit dehydrogenase-like oxidoreductase (DUF2520 family)